MGYCFYSSLRTSLQFRGKKKGKNSFTLTSESFEARYNAILELLYHIMDRPAKPPEKQLQMLNMQFCNDYDQGELLSQV